MRFSASVAMACVAMLASGPAARAAITLSGLSDWQQAPSAPGYLMTDFSATTDSGVIVGFSFAYSAGLGVFGTLGHANPLGLLTAFRDYTPELFEALGYNIQSDTQFLVGQLDGVTEGQWETSSGLFGTFQYFDVGRAESSLPFLHYVGEGGSSGRLFGDFRIRRSDGQEVLERIDFRFDVPPVPEPNSLSLAGLAVGVAALLRRNVALNGRPRRNQRPRRTARTPWSAAAS